jgi:hypothetical protein
MTHSSNAGAAVRPIKKQRILLSENKEKQREIRWRLKNWGRWGDILSLERQGIPKGDGVFRDYRPDAGDTWDGDPKPEPIDQQDAEAAEIIITEMLDVDFYARQVIIMAYYRMMTVEQIERFFTDQLGASGWSSRKVQEALSRGEQIFSDMSI